MRMTSMKEVERKFDNLCIADNENITNKKVQLTTSKPIYRN